MPSKRPLTSPIVVVAGLVVGIAGAILVKLGNPGNMGVCVACFLRDITGALGLHSAAKVQYLRPEIIGFVLGACIGALLFGEFKPRGGSSPLIRFLLGAFFMIGALIFLGCPLRMILRLGGGDLNAIAGLLGWVFGIYIGVMFLRSGFTLGRASEVLAVNSWILPGFMTFTLLLMLFLPSLLRTSAEGPGAMHAPLFISLFVGILIGILAQRSRLCFTAGFRDMILIRDPHLLMGIIAVFVGVLIANIALGQFHLGVVNQPVAHSAQLWNFGGMVLAGICAVLMGGCPLRQLILAGEGNADSAISVFGMLMGAALAHNFRLVAKPDMGGMVGGPSVYGKVALLICMVIVIVIAYANRET